MKLHSKLFETSLRRGVKQAVRASAGLKREARRGKLRRQLRFGIVFRLFASAISATAVWLSFQTTGHVAGALAILTLWTFAVAFFRASNLLNSLFGSTDLSALTYLPISDAAIFRWQRQKFLVSSIYSLIDIAAGFAVLGVALDLSWAQWIALAPLPLIAGVSLTGLAAWLATRAPLATQRVTAALGGIWFILFIVGQFIPWEKVWRLIDGQAFWINSLLPTGWAISLFQLLLPGPDWLLLVFLGLSASLIWSLKKAFARLEKNYEFKEIRIPESADLIPDDETNETPVENPDAAPRHLGVTAIEDIVQSRKFLAAPRWQHNGWFEQMLWRWFTPREKSLAEMAFPNGPTISAGWKTLFRNLAIAIVVGFGANLVSTTLHAWIIGIGVFASFVLALALIQETGHAFQKVFCSGVNIPLYAGFATGLRELSGMLFKYSAVQLPALMVCAMICGVLVTRLCGLTVTDGFMYGLRAGCLIFSSRFILIVFGFSSGTNDSASFRLRTLALLASIVGLGGLFLLLGGVGLLVPKHGSGWIITAFAIVDAYVFFRIYGWFYDANRFDLMSLPKR